MLTVQAIMVGTGCTQGLANQWLAPLQAACSKFDFATNGRIAAYLSQIGVESSGLTVLEENLNYSAARLAVVWPGRFSLNKQPNALALSIAGNPEKIANQVYANRLGNGDASSGDGWRYRGRGPIQLTFSLNYNLAMVGLTNAGLCLDLVGHPDMVKEPDIGSLVAAWYLHDEPGFAEAADKGDINSITQMVNGAPASEVNHGPLRASRYQAALKILQS